ncbi:hypothetical protein MKK55_18705 [Methylobacterium sp. J-059]|uniref:hypothetical protein n=1 Tax=Methylobacterium sp. J-059 TaxID=2836643 RepID=UPI001FB8A3E3|nr:hypothetical protein [Methylobacterium sp. J-059]MCJ2040962.1 hypothetical protein [Methylobacterium sp. J-059]
MKIVDWAELSKMPAGTFFQGIRPYDTGDLEVLGGVWDGVHLISARPLPVACGSEVLSLTDAQKEAHSIRREGEPIVYQPFGFGRDWGPGDKRRWLVWEQADRERLAGWLLDPVKACAEMNDEPHVLMKVEDLA